MQCPCHSEKSYETCCKPFHERKAFPSSPLELMRSRYSAYALHLPQYILETTAQVSPYYPTDVFKWQTTLLEWMKRCSFVNLTILGETLAFPNATVTFHATIKQGKRDCSFTEKSLFTFQGGKWLYVSRLEK